MTEIVGWNYYEDGEFCRFFSHTEKAEMDRIAASSGGTSIPVFLPCDERLSNEVVKRIGSAAVLGEISAAIDAARDADEFGGLVDADVARRDGVLADPGAELRVAR